MLAELYVKTDQFLVDRANEAVRAWNWTTGRTRADLAAIANAAGIAMIPAGSAINKQYAGAAALGAIWGYFALESTIENYDTDKREAKALQNNAKDLTVEIRKIGAQRSGTFRLTAGTICTTIGSPDVVEGNVISSHTDMMLFGAGINMLGIGNYIMRADYVQPQKNCVARGLNRLEEMIASYRTQPAPVPVQCRYQP